MTVRTRPPRTHDHTDTPTGAQAVGTREPWLWVGVSRSAWYRLMSSGAAPAPVRPGIRLAVS